MQKSRTNYALINKAFAFAEEAHKTQKRYSGEPYLYHTFETACILADLGMGPRTVAAGLLHDVIEDTPVTREELAKEFGENITKMVEGVTKLGHVRYKGGDRHIESLRKFFVATSDDIRVIIIKLADRLHNMRTLQHVPKEKRRRIATETMQVYVPIAERLNMGRIQRQLQDLSFPFLHPEEFKKITKMSKPKYKESIEALGRVRAILEEALKEEKISNINIDYRTKGSYSLFRKLERKDMDIDRIYDIAALRVIVPSISDCYRVLGTIHSIWRPLPGRIKDYIAFPKPNGYQSIHTTVFTGEGGVAEIQVRTERMHREAEFGVASHFNYKNNNPNGYISLSWFRNLLNFSTAKTEPSTENVPEWLKELAEIQKEVEVEEEFMKNLKDDFFENRIFVFTPVGDVIDLPRGSSPIDFAYQVHSDIGDHIAGAKVNGKLVSLDTKLTNGDIVDIMTKKTVKPTRKWLDYAKTTIAKRRIRSALQKK